MLQFFYDDARRGDMPFSFSVEGEIDLMNTEDGKYILVIEPHSDVYAGVSNAKLRIPLTPEQVSEFTRLVL
jgi:hypothetical protein